MKKVGMTFIAANLMVAPLGNYIEHFGGHDSSENVVEAASLAEVQLLTDVTIDATVSEPVEGEPYNLNLNLNGTGLADAELASPERTVLFYAPELAGQIEPIGTANVSVEILPINLQGDLPALYNAVGGLTEGLTGLVTGLVTGVDNALGLLIPDEVLEISGLTELNTAIDNLNNLDVALQDLTNYTGNVAYTVNPDGTIVVSFTDGLGNHLNTAINGLVQGLLDDVSLAIESLEILVFDDVPLLGDILNTVINPLLLGTVSNLLGLVTDLTDDLNTGVIDLTESLASVQVIGNTTVNLDVLVNNPTNTEGPVSIMGAGIRDSVIDAALLTSLQSQDTVTFPPDQVDEDTTAPELSGVDIDGDSTTGYNVTGSTEPEARISITNEEGTEVGTGTTDLEGNFNVDVPAELVEPGEELSVIATDAANNSSEPAFVTVPADGADTTAPELSGVDIDGDSTTGYNVTGSTEPEAVISITNTEGTEVGTGITDLEGNFNVDVPTELVEPGEELSVIATDDADNSSEPAFVIVPADEADTTAPELGGVTIDGNTTDGYDVTGSTEPNADITIRDADGTDIATGVSDDEGNFTVPVSADDTAPGDDLSVVATDDANNESEPTIVTVPEDPSDTTPPELSDVGIDGDYINGYSINGVTEPGSTVTFTNEDGENIGSIVADEEGIFNQGFTRNEVAENEVISLISTNEDGVDSEPAEVTVPVTTLEAPTGSDFYEDELLIEGEGIVGAEVIAYVDDVEVGSTTVPEAIFTFATRIEISNNGTYTIELDENLDAGTEIVLLQILDGKVSDTTTVTVLALDDTDADADADGGPTLNDVTIDGNSSDGYIVSGSTESPQVGDYVQVRDSDGNIAGSGIVGEDGDFAINVNPVLVYPGEELTVIGISADGTEGAPVYVTVPAGESTPVDPNDTEAPILGDFTIDGNTNDGYVISGTGEEPGDAVIVENANGERIGAGTIAEDGSVVINIHPSLVTPGETLSIYGVDANGNFSEAITLTVPEDGSGSGSGEDTTSPEVSDVVISGNSQDGYTVTGVSNEPGTVTITDADGNVIAEGTVDEDGNFSINIDPDAVTPGQVLFVAVTDEAGNVTEGIQIVVPGDGEAVTASTGDGEQGTSEVTKVDGDSDSDKDSGSEILPDTGVAAAPLGIIATVLLAAGAGLLFFRRKSKNS